MVEGNNVGYPTPHGYGNETRIGNGNEASIGNGNGNRISHYFDATLSTTNFVADIRYGPRNRLTIPVNQNNHSHSKEIKKKGGPHQGRSLVGPAAKEVNQPNEGWKCIYEIMHYICMICKP